MCDIVSLFADHKRHELVALVKDFSTAWDCVRASLVNYGQSTFVAAQ